MIEFLRGKKTYLLAGCAAALLCVSWFSPPNVADLLQRAAALLLSFTPITLRLGIKNDLGN